MKLVSSLILLLSLAACSSAATVGFVEEFPTDGANWLNDRGNLQQALLSHQASGGPDGSSYAEGTYNFVNFDISNLPPGRGATTILFRGQQFANASGGQLFGNWLTDGVEELSFAVRHDATDPNNGDPLDLNFFVRIPVPNNSVSAVIESPISVPANQWTTLSFKTFFGNPFLTLTGPPTPGFHASIFSNVTRIQIGADVPPALAQVDQTVTFGLDKISVVPEPSSYALCFLTIALASGLMLRVRKAEAIA